MKKSIILILSVLTVTVILSGCVKTMKNEKKPVAQIVLEELCSEQYEGRLIGTEGNRKAEQYLEKAMKELKIDPYGKDSYKLSYMQTIVDPNEQNTIVLVNFKDGTKQKLIHGKDFYTTAASKPVKATVPLTSESIDEVDGVKVQAEERLTLSVGNPTRDRDFVVCIAHLLKQELMNKGAISVDITSEYAARETELSNIVGIIKGQAGTKKAVVLTAHFDHVGKQGDFLFNGVLDNASGTATLISTASKLKELTGSKQLDYDIVIAATNSEEAGTFEGSVRVVESLEKDYEDIVNINIDCVGSGEELTMGQTNKLNYGLADKFKVALTNNSISFNDHECPLTDAISFIDKNYPAISVGAEITEEFMLHGNEMKTSDINIDEIERISNAISELVMNNSIFEDAGLSDIQLSGKQVFEEGSDEWLDKLDEAVSSQLNGETLKMNQQMYVEFDNKIVHVGESSTNDIAEFNKFFPEIIIPEKIFPYSISRITVISSQIGQYGIVNKQNIPKEIKINKPYEIVLKHEDLSGMSLEYTNSNETLFIAARKHNGNLIQSDEYNEVLQLDMEGYEQLKLVSHKNSDKFYSILKETDELTVRFNYFDTNNNESLSFTKEEIIKKIDELKLK